MRRSSLKITTTSRLRTSTVSFADIQPLSERTGALAVLNVDLADNVTWFTELSRQHTVPFSSLPLYHLLLISPQAL